jgi:hypothetical protein
MWRMTKTTASYDLLPGLCRLPSAICDGVLFFSMNRIACLHQYHMRRKYKAAVSTLSNRAPAKPAPTRNVFWPVVIALMAVAILIATWKPSSASPPSSHWRGMPQP